MPPTEKKRRNVETPKTEIPDDPQISQMAQIEKKSRNAENGSASRTADFADSAGGGEKPQRENVERERWAMPSLRAGLK
jgi:hypothetical protein